MSFDGVGGALADLAPVEVHPAHAGLGAERHELGAHGLDVALPQAVLLLGQHHDAPSFRRLVGERSELGRVGQVVSLTPSAGKNAVA